MKLAALRRKRVILLAAPVAGALPRIILRRQLIGGRAGVKRTSSVGFKLAAVCWMTDDLRAPQRHNRKLRGKHHPMPFIRSRRASCMADLALEADAHCTARHFRWGHRRTTRSRPPHVGSTPLFRNTSVNGGCRSPEFVSAQRCRPRRSRRSRKAWLSSPQPFNGNFTIFGKIRDLCSRTEGDARRQGH